MRMRVQWTPAPYERLEHGCREQCCDKMSCVKVSCIAIGFIMASPSSCNPNAMSSCSRVPAKWSAIHVNTSRLVKLLYL